MIYVSAQFKSGNTLYVVYECLWHLYFTSKGFNVDFQSGFCFIDGMCVQNSEAKIADKCLTCEPYIDKYNWTRSMKDF